MRSRKRYLFGLLVIAVGALVPSPASAVDPPTLVAAGFDSPRGVDFFQGTLVVGEAGHGGKNCIPGTPPQPTVLVDGQLCDSSWASRHQR